MRAETAVWGCPLPQKLGETCISLQKTASSCLDIDLSPATVSGCSLTTFCRASKSSKVNFAEMAASPLRASVSSEYQLSDQDTDGELKKMCVGLIMCCFQGASLLYLSTELMKEFEATLTMPMGLSEAVAAIQTLLQFIKNCKGMCIQYMITQVAC